MRVLFVGPGSNKTFQSWIAPFLPEVEARLVTTEPVPEAFRREHPGLRIHLLPRPALRRLPRRLFLHTADYLLEVNALVRLFRPDLIHLHYVSQLDTLALLGVRRTPIVLTVFGADVLEDQVPRPFPIDQAVRALFRRARAVTAKTAFLAERCRALGARPERVHRIAWGVDISRFEPRDRAAARAALGIPNDEQVLLSSRALTPLYNHEPLVRAVARLSHAQQRALTIAFVRNAQEPDHAARIAALARELQVPVRFLEPLPHARMPELYAAANACASLPASDGLPETLLEALACGRPTLALDLDAYRELPFATDAMQRVAHDAGQPRIDALVAGIERVLDGGERPGLAAARAWIAENANFSRSVDQVRALYREVAGT